MSAAPFTRSYKGADSNGAIHSEQVQLQAGTGCSSQRRGWRCGFPCSSVSRRHGCSYPATGRRQRSRGSECRPPLTGGNSEGQTCPKTSICLPSAQLQICPRLLPRSCRHSRRALQAEVAGVLSGASALGTAAAAASSIVIAPALEELVYRGFLLPSLTKRLPAAAAVGAGCFALWPEELMSHSSGFAATKMCTYTTLNQFPAKNYNIVRPSGLPAGGRQLGGVCGGAPEPHRRAATVYSRRHAGRHNTGG